MLLTCDEAAATAKITPDANFIGIRFDGGRLRIQNLKDAKSASA